MMSGNLAMNLWIRIHLEEYLSKLLNVKVEIAYSSLSFWDGEGRIGPVKVASPPGGRAPYIITMDGIDVNIEPLSLLSESIVIEDMELDRPEIFIEGDEARVNLQPIINRLANIGDITASEMPDLYGDTPQIKVVIEDISAEDGALIMVDSDGKKTSRIEMPEKIFEAAGSESAKIPAILLYDIISKI